MKHSSSYIYPQCAHLYTRKASNSFQSTVVYFSDGAASQYNNFKKLVNLCHHRRDHDLDAEWHFLPLAKENRPVTKTSLQATVTNQVLTPQHMLALAIAGIKYLYISKKDIAKNFQDFAHEERYARCKTIPGTRSHHSFIPISETVLEMKRLSLDVVGNQFSFGFEKHAPCCFQIVPIQNDAQFQPGHYIACNYDQQWYVWITME